AALAFAVDFEQRYRGRISALEPAEFTAMMRELEHALEASAKPALYAQLLHSQDATDTSAGRLIGRVREAGARRGVHLIFFSIELAALDDEKAARLYADDEARAYRHLVERERSHRPYQLSGEEEKVLTDFTPVGGPAWVRLFSELCAEIRVERDGGIVTLPAALAELRDADRDTRRQAAAGITESLNHKLSTRAYIVNVLVQDKAISDRLRGDASWISSRNLSNEITDEAVEALVDAVTSRTAMVARYYEAKRRLLGLPDLYEWDRDAPVADVDHPLTWPEARTLVLDAYDSLSP